MLKTLSVVCLFPFATKLNLAGGPICKADRRPGMGQAVLLLALNASDTAPDSHFRWSRHIGGKMLQDVQRTVDRRVQQCSLPAARLHSLLPPWTLTRPSALGSHLYYSNQICLLCKTKGFSAMQLLVQCSSCNLNRM